MAESNEQPAELVVKKKTLQAEMNHPHQDMMRVKPVQRKGSRRTTKWRAQKEALIQENEDLLLENKDLRCAIQELCCTLGEKARLLEACKIHETCEAEKRTLRLEKEQVCQEMDQLRLKACDMEEALSHKREELKLLQKEMTLSTEEYNNKLQAEVEDKESTRKEMEQFRLKKTEKLNLLQKDMTSRVQELEFELKMERMENRDIQQHKEVLCQNMENLEKILEKERALNKLQKARLLTAWETVKRQRQGIQALITIHQQKNRDMLKLAEQVIAEREQRHSLSQEVAALREQLQTLKLKNQTLPPQSELNSREAEEGSGSQDMREPGEDLKKKSKKSSVFRRIVKFFTPKKGKKKSKGAEKGEKGVQQ